MPAIYEDRFNNWADVQKEFQMSDPEPAEVFYAGYSYEDYSGSAHVLYRDANGRFGYVEGGHCSCNGLEDQWSPEFYTRDQLLGQVERANYGFFKDYAKMILAIAEQPLIRTRRRPPGRRLEL